MSVVVDILHEFIDAAKSLSRNPLSLIALFQVFIYCIASLIVLFRDNLDSNERIVLIWFLVLFPTAVLIVFAWLVSCHHRKLYAPSDFRDENNFMLSFGKSEELLEQASEEAESTNEESIEADEVDESLVDEKTEKQIMNSLSKHKWKWRTKERIMVDQNLDAITTNLGLTGLIQKGLVKASKGKSGNRIYGLATRIDK
jgi:hypothetical protein